MGSLPTNMEDLLSCLGVVVQSVKGEEKPQPSEVADGVDLTQNDLGETISELRADIQRIKDEKKRPTWV